MHPTQRLKLSAIFFRHFVPYGLFTPPTGRDKTVLSRPRRPCEQAISHPVTLRRSPPLSRGGASNVRRYQNRAMSRSGISSPGECLVHLMISLCTIPSYFDVGVLHTSRPGFSIIIATAYNSSRLQPLGHPGLPARSCVPPSKQRMDLLYMGQARAYTRGVRNAFALHSAAVQSSASSLRGLLVTEYLWMD